MSKKTELGRKRWVSGSRPKPLRDYKLTDSYKSAGLNLDEQDDHNNQELNYRMSSNA